MALELVGGLVAEELHAVAAFDERQPFGKQALEFDRANLRAVLLLLAALLGVRIVIELALHALGGAVEEVDRRPQQIFEVRFEAGVAERRDQRVEDVGHGPAGGGGFGQRPWVRLVAGRTIAIELEFGEDAVGGR